MINIINVHEIERCSDDWDRSEHSPCDFCDIVVDEFGGLRCRSCRCMFSGRGALKTVKRMLQGAHGEFWQKEYEELMEVRDLVRRKKYRDLDLIYCTYTDKDGTIKNDRYYYEKARRI